jgi:hypothetical protein
VILALFSRYWIALAVGLGLVLASFGAGYKVRSWKCDAALLKVERANEKARAKMQAQVEASAAAYETDRSEAHVNSITRQETVRTIYRDRQVSADCAVPDVARSVLDDAVSAANTDFTR